MTLSLFLAAADDMSWLGQVLVVLVVLLGPLWERIRRARREAVERQRGRAGAGRPPRKGASAGSAPALESWDGRDAAPSTSARELWEALLRGEAPAQESEEPAPRAEAPAVRREPARRVESPPAVTQPLAAPLEELDAGLESALPGAASELGREVAAHAQAAVGSLDSHLPSALGPARRPGSSRARAARRSEDSFPIRRLRRASAWQRAFVLSEVLGPPVSQRELGGPRAPLGLR